MAQPVKLSDRLIEAARAAADDADRSMAGQIEHWARLGRAVETTLTVEETARLKRGGPRGGFGPHAVRDGDPAASNSASNAALKNESLPAMFPALLERQRPAIEALCHHYGVRRLGFFGSVLRAGFDPAAGSDLDATVEFRPADGPPTARQYFDFKTALEQLLGVPVDLVELESMPDSRLKRIITRTQRTFHVEAP